MHTQVLITKPFQNFTNKEKKNINKEKKSNFIVFDMKLFRIIDN